MHAKEKSDTSTLRLKFISVAARRTEITYYPRELKTNVDSKFYIYYELKIHSNYTRKLIQSTAILSSSSSTSFEASLSSFFSASVFSSFLSSALSSLILSSAAAVLVELSPAGFL